jgi:hypothetical protein
VLKLHRHMSVAVVLCPKVCVGWRHPHESLHLQLCWHVKSGVLLVLLPGDCTVFDLHAVSRMTSRLAPRHLLITLSKRPASVFLKKSGEVYLVILATDEETNTVSPSVVSVVAVELR